MDDDEFHYESFKVSMVESRSTSTLKVREGRND